VFFQQFFAYFKGGFFLDNTSEKNKKGEKNA
jgi:hypothetical protein